MPFADIVGQDGAISLLRGLLEADRLPHALLFVGPEGVGKHTTARALAQALLCRRRQAAAGPSLFGDELPAAGAPEGCGECPACTRIARGEHPDVHEVAGSGVTGRIQVDTVRELVRTLHLSAVEGPCKIAIVDPAGRMNRESANAFLKTLEEPPRETILILVSRERSLLLPTIVSRCQVVRFGLLDRDVVGRYLAGLGIAGSDGRPVGEEALQAAVALSQGSIGLARHFAEAGVESARQALRSWLTGLTEGQGRGALRWAEAFSGLHKDDGEGFEAALEGLMLFFRDVAARCAGSPPEALAGQDLLPEIERWAERVDLKGALDRLQAVFDARRALGSNAHKEMTGLELARRLAL